MSRIARLSVVLCAGLSLMGLLAQAEEPAATLLSCQTEQHLEIGSEAPLSADGPVFLAGGIGEVCFDGFNGCYDVTPHTGNCCWRCPGGSQFWSCTNVSTAAACKRTCITTCQASTCGWI